MLASTLLALGATLHRTGRTHDGNPTSSLAQAVRYVCVQVGGKGDKPGDIHAKWDKDFALGPMPMHISCAFRHPGGRQLLNAVSLSGSALDVAYKATHQLDKESRSTDVSLAYSLPGGTQVMADAIVAGEGGVCKLRELSAFHTAGPINLQPAWNPVLRMLRLKLGQGGMRHRCPLSIQTEFQPGSDAPASYELGMRHQFDHLRQLRARLLLPADAERMLTAEYQDAKIDKEAVWYAKASLPLDGDHRGFGAAELSLRRAWQW